MHFNKAFLIATVCNGGFVVCQIIFGIMANSTSLLADALHNFGDVLGLGVAWVGNILLQRLPTNYTTYGLKKISILAALTNGLLLVFSCGVIAAEAITKFFSPTPIHAFAVIIVASVGIIINGATAVLFLRGTNDLNIHATFLHLFYDALISLGVVVAAVLIYWTQWLWLDPLFGLLIALIILKNIWGLFAHSFYLIIDAVPKQISWTKVREALAAQLGVEGIHDLHIWAISTQENALSVHLLVSRANFGDRERQKLVNMLREQHNIHHATIQIEHDLKYCADSCSPILY